MSNTASIERRQLTAESICEHVSTSPLLAQLLRQLTIDRILSEWQPALPARSIPADIELDLDSTSLIDHQVPILDLLGSIELVKLVAILIRSDRS